MLNHLLHAFAHQIETQPDAIALVGFQNGVLNELSWQQFAASAFERACELNEIFDRDQSIPRRVGYASNNDLGQLVTSLACMICQAIEVPVDHRLPAPKAFFENRIGGCWLEDHPLHMRTTLQSAQVHSEIRATAEATDVDETALVLWTSGTTSQPKGVMLSHRNLCGNAIAKLNKFPESITDVRLMSLPLCHAYARTCGMGTWILSGCKLALGLGYTAWMDLAPKVEPTVANVVPSLADRLLSLDDDFAGLRSLRLLGCGGAAMSETAFEQWKHRRVTVLQGYGLTETAPVVCSATPENAAPGLVGEFVDGWEHEIRGGRLFVRGPHVMRGYWLDDVATGHRIDEAGWLDTGDLVEIDSESKQMRVIGRADDTIVLDDGHKVNPRAIEMKVEEVRGVLHAIIVGSGRRCSLWIDLAIDSEHAQIEEQIAVKLKDLPKWERPASVNVFKTPLTAEANELTHKGTIRREVIIKNRIAD